jgi:hypothetical protein
MTPARLTIRRAHSDDARERQVVVSLDGSKIATLMFGDEVSREIEPGRHRLRMHNTLVWKTIDFDAPAGGAVGFTVINRPGRGTFGLLSILGARPLYLQVTREP